MFNEAAYMLQATALLRQSFGIVSFTNSSRMKPFTDAEGERTLLVVLMLFIRLVLPLLV